MDINNRVLDIIKSNKNITQKDLASYIDVSASTVNNWLKLGRSIPSEYIIPISEFLGVSCEFILTGTVQKKISGLSEADTEWISLLHKLPHDAQLEFIGEIKGYLKCLAKESVAPPELKQAK